jgi:hypothetical protein
MEEASKLHEPSPELKPFTTQVEIFVLARELARLAHDKGASLITTSEVESFLLAKGRTLPSWGKKLLFRLGYVHIDNLRRQESLFAEQKPSMKPEFEPTHRLQIIKQQVRIGVCNSCGRMTKRWGGPFTKFDVPLHVAKVIRLKDNTKQWRCSLCMWRIDRDASKSLALLDRMLREAFCRALNTRERLQEQVRKRGSARPKYIELLSTLGQYCSKCGRIVDNGADIWPSSQHGYICPNCYEFYCFDCVWDSPLRDGLRVHIYENNAIHRTFICPSCKVELESLGTFYSLV